LLACFQPGWKNGFINAATVMLPVCEHAYACVLSSDKITAGDGLTTGYILFRLLQRLEREISLLSLKLE